MTNHEPQVRTRRERRPAYQERPRAAWLLASLLALGGLTACASDQGRPGNPPAADQSGSPPIVNPTRRPIPATVVARGAAANAPAPTRSALTNGGGAGLQVTGGRMKSPEYGIQAFLWWRPELAERDILMIKDMGFGWVKQGFGWRDIESQKGTFDWSHTDHIVETITRYGGVKLLVRVDHQPEWARGGCQLQGPPKDLNDLADFLVAVATRYKGHIAAYQIWNEPNLAREWCGQSPSPKLYAQMLKAAYAAIKRADPGALVISAGLSPTGTQPPEAMPDDAYLDGLYAAMGGKSDGYFDLLGVHAAGFAAPPETSPDEAAASPEFGGERFFTFRRVEDLRQIQEKWGDGGKQIAILEMGWTSDQVHPSYNWHAVSEKTKADYLVRAYQFAKANWSPWIGLMSAIYVCNPDWKETDEQYWWCVTNPDGTPRPAFAALKAMPK